MVAAIRCTPAVVLGDSCHPARTPAPATARGKIRRGEGGEKVLGREAGIIMRATRQHRAPNTY